MKLTSQSEYEQYVETVARNNVKRDGSSPRSVAETVITDVVAVGDEVTMTTTPAPYHDECVQPSDVIRYGTVNATPDDLEDNFRSTAVSVLAGDIEEAMQRYEGQEL